MGRVSKKNRALLEKRAAALKKRDHKIADEYLERWNITALSAVMPLLEQAADVIESDARSGRPYNTRRVYDNGLTEALVRLRQLSMQWVGEIEQDMREKRREAVTEAMDSFGQVIDNVVKQPVEYTMTEEDYEALIEDGHEYWVRAAALTIEGIERGMLENMRALYRSEYREPNNDI